MYWRHFPTQSAAVKAIQEIINPQPFKTPFESPLISDLICERHYFCSIKGLRPQRFRKIPSFGTYSFEGDLNYLTHGVPIGWHPVSWRKCLAPPLSEWDRIVRAMRDRCEPAKSSHREAHPVCEECGSEQAVETHHQSPSFAAIVKAVRDQVSDADITSCLSKWDWFAKDSFSLPDDSKITLLFDRAHDLCLLRALCKACHSKLRVSTVTL